MIICHSRKEMLVIDYPLQQHKLIPCLSTNYAFFSSFMILEKLRVKILAGETIQFERLPEVNRFRWLTIDENLFFLVSKLHAISSGLKAYISTIAERWSQLCRVSCGGHGFLVAGGIKPVNNSLDAACSYEGDNAVLFQQTARYYEIHLKIN